MNDIQTVANEMLDNSKFESGWSKKLKNSQHKSREWLFRHADELYQFQQECKKRELELPAALGTYVNSKLEEWLNYSPESAKEWIKAGSFIAKLRQTKKLELSHLPISKATIVEFARMDDEELESAKEHNIVHPEVTYGDVRDFRASYKQERKEEKVKEEAEDLRNQKKQEESALEFEYDDNIPDWIVEKIEDLVAELGKDKVQSTIKFPSKLPNGQESTWVCTLMKNRWSASEFIKGAEPPPKDEKAPKPDNQESIFAELLLTFGIDIKKRKINEETVDWLLVGFRRAYHPDKGEHNDELTQTAVAAATRLKKYGSIK